MADTNCKYPFADLRPDQNVKNLIAKAISRVIDSGRYIGGPECERFESKLKHYTGTKYCVGVSNGLDALRLIFRAYIELGKLKPEDEVIVPANTYIASVLAITEMGLKPVLVEPDRDTLNLDWHKAIEAIGPNTRALLTVHLYGRVAWNEGIAEQMRRLGILIIEDNAQAIGARSEDGVSTGNLGNAAAFSFYPTKNLGALGDAGAVTTNEKDLAEAIRAIANYGSDRRYHNIYTGYNCRLDPIQAAILSEKLSFLVDETRRRRNIASIYNTHIKNPAIKLPPFEDQSMVWHQYVVQVDDRQRFTNYLTDNGVGWDIHYPVPIHLQPCYREKDILTTRLDNAQGETGNDSHRISLPITEHICQHIVSLPISAPTTSEDASSIAEIINTYPAIQ